MKRTIQHLGLQALCRLNDYGAGSRLLLSVASASEPGLRLLRIHQPGAPMPLLIRPGTTDLHVVRQVFTLAQYDCAEWAPYSRHIEDCYAEIIRTNRRPLILDAGANMGASSIWYAIRFPDAAIYAVEPDPENFQVLALNVRSYPNIRPVHAAIWSDNARLALENPGAQAWGRRVKPGEDGCGIDGIVVPDLLRRDPAAVPLIAKIDVEGAEVEILKNGGEWLNEFPLVVFEPHDRMYRWLGHWGASAHAFFAVLSSRRHEYLFRDENVFAFRHPDGG